MERAGICVRAMLVAAKEDGAYTRYVFEILSDEVDYTERFITLTRCYNWNGISPEMFQEGFVEYKFCRAGVDDYYDRKTTEFNVYQFDANYFLDFTPITHVLQNGYVVKQNALQIS